MKLDDVTWSLATVDSSPSATISFVLFISPRREKAMIIDKAMFEVKESLFLPLCTPSNFSHSGSKPRFGREHQNHKKTNQEVLKGPWSHGQASNKRTSYNVVFFNGFTSIEHSSIFVVGKSMFKCSILTRIKQISLPRSCWNSFLLVYISFSKNSKNYQKGRKNVASTNSITEGMSAWKKLLVFNQDEYPNFIYTGIVLLKSTKMNTLISYILE